MVTMFAKDAQIVDKNSKERSGLRGMTGMPEKVVLDDGKQVKENNVSIGETVHFRLQINTSVLLQTSRSSTSLKILFGRI